MGFVYKDVLDQHMRTHTDIATFSCDICGKSFKQRAGLYKHKNTHGPPKHVCEVCGREFFRSDYLRKHRKTHENKDIVADVQAE